MLWGKKEKEYELPDLPPVKPSPSLSHSASETDEYADSDNDEEDSEKHGLPSFPDSPHQRGFSQAAIKDAIGSDEEFTSTDSLERISPLQPIHPRTFKTIEMDSPWQSAQPLLTPPSASNTYRFMREAEQKNRDVFVKIDKFYSARRALETMKEKLNNIDELLRKIRETKMREEQELSAWEKEMSEVRAHIQEVTAHIFEKVE
mgnify:CR=1 FL=1